MKQKRNEKTTVSLRDPYSGERVRVSNIDRATAEYLRSKTRVAKAEVKLGLASPETLRQAQAAQSRLTVREAIERRYGRMKRATAHLHAQLLKNHLGALADVRLNELTAERVWRWWESLDRMRLKGRVRPIAEATKARTLGLLVTSVRCARRAGLCITQTEGWPSIAGRVGVKAFEPGKRAALYSSAEVMRLLNAAFEWDKKNGTNVACVVIFLIETGMRQAEAAALTCEDILQVSGDAVDGGVNIVYEVRVNKQLAPQRIGGGIVPIKTARADAAGWPERKPRPRIESDLGRLAVAELLRSAAEWGQDRLFFSRLHGGSPRTTPQVLQPSTLRAIWARAGLPDAERAVVHSLRHSHVLLNLKATGGDLHAAAQAVGHASVKTTTGYLDAISRPRSVASRSLMAVHIEAVDRRASPLMLPVAAQRPADVDRTTPAESKPIEEREWFRTVFAAWTGEGLPDEIAAWIRAGAETARSRAKKANNANPAAKARREADARRHRWMRFVRNTEQSRGQETEGAPCKMES